MQFDKDFKKANADDITVLKKRKAELDGLNQRLKECKNSFRARCIQQEIERLSKEYARLIRCF